ncbi:hypothetical protein GCM10023228_18780 [Brevibacillus fulvus]
MAAMLQRFIERLKRKPYLNSIRHNWTRRVGIIVEDQQLRFSLTFRGEEMEWCEWQEGQPIDLLLTGTERNFQLLFAGDALSYLYAKKEIKISGHLRDQLKLETLIRLS